MRRTVLLTVALVAVLALAGCTGGSGPAANGTTNATTNAPNATTTASASYAPGVNASGVTDAPTLSTAYSNALQNSSYSVTQRYTAAFANKTTYVQTRVTGNVSDRQSYRLTNSQSGSALDDTATTYYANGTAVLTKTTTGGNTTYGVDSVSPGKRYSKLGVVDNDFVYLTFASANTTSASVTQGDTHLSATGFTVTPEHGLSNVTNTSASAVVSPDGTVTFFHLSYAAQVNGQTVYVKRTWTYDTNNVSVSQPSWTAQA